MKAGKYIMVCDKCRTHSKDVSSDPHAWDGWSIINIGHKTKHLCPDCLNTHGLLEALEHGDKKPVVLD